MIHKTNKPSKAKSPIMAPASLPYPPDLAYPTAYKSLPIATAKPKAAAGIGK